MVGHKPTRAVPACFSLDLIVLLLLAYAVSGRAANDDAELIERGRYLVKIAACNDCHTAGYAESAGAVEERLWLTGDSIGWLGPWGTTYPSNLRLSMQQIEEAQWLTLARTAQYRPPMPWFMLRDMSDDDLRAIYRFVRHLGPAGKPAPSFLPPGQVPQGAYYEFHAPADGVAQGGRP